MIPSSPAPNEETHITEILTHTHVSLYIHKGSIPLWTLVRCSPKRRIPKQHKKTRKRVWCRGHTLSTTQQQPLYIVWNTDFCNNSLLLDVWIGCCSCPSWCKSDVQHWGFDRTPYTLYDLGWPTWPYHGDMNICKTRTLFAFRMYMTIYGC